MGVSAALARSGGTPDHVCCLGFHSWHAGVGVAITGITGSSPDNDGMGADSKDPCRTWRQRVAASVALSRAIAAIVGRVSSSSFEVFGNL